MGTQLGDGEYRNRQTSWTQLHAGLHQTLRDRRLLSSGQKILIAVSGGQDSMCLARLLLDLQPKWHWELMIAHCDHRWREDSAQNAAFVQQIAQSWQVPYFQATAEQVLTSEAAARNWRYQALSHIAQTHDYSVIVTGHTASDRAETLLYNLIRGSGSDGLQALTWQRSLGLNQTLVRPLLSVTRAQTAEFCQTAHLPIWEDQTNQDLRYARNRLRLEVLPYLQTHFNPQVEATLAQTAELLHAEVDHLEAEARALQATVVFSDDQGICLDRQSLQNAPLALQRRVVRQVLQQVLPVAPSFEHIEKLIALISAPNRSQTDPFPGGAIAHTDGAMIKLTPILMSR